MTALATPPVADALKSAGLTLALTPERALKVAPASILTPELRDLINSNKSMLVNWLIAANDDWNVSIPPETSPKTIAKFRAASQALNASQAYLDHHFGCKTCIAAGQGAMYGSRCEVGASLWMKYSNN